MDKKISFQRTRFFGASSRTRTYDPTLAVPESCYPLGARATFDRGANPFSLHHPPGALGGVAVNSRNAADQGDKLNPHKAKQKRTQMRPFLFCHSCPKKNRLKT